MESAVRKSDAIYTSATRLASPDDLLLMGIFNRLTRVYLPLTRVLVYQVEGRFPKARQEIAKGLSAIDDALQIINDYAQTPNPIEEIVDAAKPTVSVLSVLFRGVDAFIQADIVDLEGIRPYFEGVRGVFHLAALPRIPYSIEHPVETNEVNVLGMLHVLEAAREKKVKRVVHTSSSAVYGSPIELPMRLEHAVHPLNPYALQKYIGELYARQFSELFGLETVSLRPFNVYGSRMADEGGYGTILSIFKKLRNQGEPLTIDGTGEQTRDFIHAEDVARANILAMESDRVGKGEILNIGSGERYSVNQIAELFGGPIRHTPGRIGDASHTLADISRTTELLGWTPQVPFREGVLRLLREEGILP